MLSGITPMTTLPTADLGRSRAFYEGVLGFTAEPGMPDGGVIYRCGESAVYVYPSSYAGTNQATAISFGMNEAQFDQEVSALREAGVTFDTFEMEGLEWDDGVALMPGMRAVWFRDPDGNILNVESTPE